jgi:predicted regulator of Ras-like GTPase activity (Roadblock/LC7/MglB family)
LYVHDSRLTDIIAEVINSSADINVGLLCSADGFPIAFAINSESDEDVTMLSAMGSAVHSISNQALTELKTGPFETTIVEGALGSFLIKEVNKYIFCCHVPKKDGLGARVRSYLLGIALDAMEGAAEKIKRYLDELEKDYAE